jgi:deoxyribonuclease V
MKLPKPLHRWTVSPTHAVRLQRELVERVRIEPLLQGVRLVAGVDATISTDDRWLLAGVAVWDVRESELVETRLAKRRACFPYVPGLLSFREAPAVLAAVRKLRVTPDVFLFDGQGRAHPRRFGLASHAGVLVDSPSVGCAKSRLYGKHQEPATRRGSRRRLIDPSDGQTIGAVVRTRDRVKCVYVSIGHRVTLADAIRLVLSCHSGYRIPQPLRLAHQLVTAGRAHL